jgi:predicted DNA-binding protein (MmcQ/YjbR family)
LDGQDVLAWCRGQADVSEERPFGPETIVFKRNGKMFLTLPAEHTPARMTLKNDPNLAEALREQYPAIQPGYHMNKRHWSTIALDGSVPGNTLQQLVEDAYGLVGPKRRGAATPD